MKSRDSGLIWIEADCGYPSNSPGDAIGSVDDVVIRKRQQDIVAHGLEAGQNRPHDPETGVRGGRDH